MNFALLVRAEFVKLNSRLSARVGLLVSVGLGLLMPLALFGLANSGLIIQGAEADAFFDTRATRPLVWALYVRNFLFVRAFLVVLGAQSVAGELASKTLREDLLRPVPRYQVYMAKWLSLIGWDALSLLATFLVASVFGMGLLGLDGDWMPTLLAFGLNLVADAGVIAFVLAFAACTRSTVATIAGVLVALMVDKGLGIVLPLASGIAAAFETSPIIVRLINQWPILPSAAFGIWNFPLPDVEHLWESVAALFLYMATSLLIGLFAFKRTHVP